MFLHMIITFWKTIAKFEKTQLIFLCLQISLYNTWNSEKFSFFFKNPS